MKKQNNSQKVFVILLFRRFGDSLIANSLIQNIKRLYPDSKTVAITKKEYLEAVKYQKDVDETIIFDNKGKHKGLFGILRFVFEFPYKNVYCLFKLCKKARGNIIAFLLHPKKVLGENEEIKGTMQERYLYLLKQVTDKELVDLPIVYNADDCIESKFENLIQKGKKYIAFCSVSSTVVKDMPVETGIEVVNKFKQENYEVIFLGTGQAAQDYAFEMKKNNCKFINLVDKTTIYEMAQILRNCEGLISVDTGTMHLGYANNVPTVCIFYRQSIWSPDEKIYPHTILPEENTAQGIFDSFLKVKQRSNLIK